MLNRMRTAWLLPAVFLLAGACSGGQQDAAQTGTSAAAAAAENPCNPCAAANPCATNPCATNPCAANPCATNPCSTKKSDT